MKNILVIILLLPLFSFSQPISKGLVGYWNFDNNILDQSISGNDGILTSSVMPSPVSDRNDISNSCYDFSIGEYITIGDPAEYDFGSQEFTISTWVYKTTSTSNYNYNIISKWNTGSNKGSNEWALTTASSNSNNFPHFGVEIGNHYEGVTSSVELELNQWYHIVAIRRTGSVELYLNGILVGSKVILLANQGPVNNASGRTLNFAKSDGNGNPYYTEGCRIDETMIFNRALSDSEIDLLGERYKKIQTFSVSKSSAIKSMKFNEGDIVFTNTGAKYLIQNDDIDDYPIDNCVVIPTLNGKFAIMQVRDGGFYVEDFGAIPNDDLDDSEAIQKCIDAAIKLTEITSKVNIGPGQFDLDKGLVISRWHSLPPNPSELGGVSLNLSGNIPVYGTDQRIGSVTVFNLRVSSFSVAVQRARNTVIENINFIGSADEYQNFGKKAIIENNIDDWGSNIGIRTNTYSPDCAIAIDPFINSVNLIDQYPGYTELYENGKSGGSSMLLIRGCNFRYHYIAIANNPSNGVQNGDNIRVENSRVANVHTFWASGQTQARGNSINNIYSLYVNRFVDCNSIGTGVGTPPNITNCNLAGFTKQIVNMKHSGFSHFRMSNVYAESLFSIGYINSHNVSFDQCQFKFMRSEEEDGIYTTPYHLFVNNGVATFSDCNLEYYTSQFLKRSPFRMYTNGLNIIGGHIEGGVVTNGIIGLNKANQINYQNVNYINFSKSSRIGSKLNGELGGNSLSQLHGEIMIGGDEFKGYADGRHVYENRNPTYNYKYFGTYVIHLDATKERAYFIHNNSSQFQKGDNIMTSNVFDNSTSYLPYPTPASGVYTNVIGYVSEISYDTVFIADIPYNLIFDPSPKFLYSIEYPIFFIPFWGDITSGSNVIANVNFFSGVNWDKFLYKKIDGEGILDGTHITAYDVNAGTVTLSTNANQTNSSVYFYNATMKQTVYRDKSTIPTLFVPYITGCQIFLDQPALTIYGYDVPKGGFPGNPAAPTIYDAEFKALVY